MSKNPSPFEWLVAVVCLIVQQDGAFTSVPALMSGDSLRATVNPLNTIAVTISTILFALVLFPRIREVASLAKHNLASMLFLVLVLMSAVWSIHPDITLRRGAGYLLTIALASYLVVRFDIDGRMRVLSASFAVSALSSLLFVALFPQFGIMQGADLGGAWRGVFPHKNVLGPIMALAMFVELYVVVTNTRRNSWRFLMLAVYGALVLLSRSATAISLSALYSGGALLYVLWRRNRSFALLVLVNCILVLIAAAIIVETEPGLALSALGKDSTLTGRTIVWNVVLEFIREKPLLGWGYHAMWVLGDPTTAFAERLIGQWGVASAHNSFLEITLQLGLVGLGVMLAILGSGLVRGFRCCRRRVASLGWFSLLYFGGAILAAQTIETLGRSQSISWVVFNVLLFGCGQELAFRRKARVPNAVRDAAMSPSRVDQSQVSTVGMAARRNQRMMKRHQRISSDSPYG